MTKKILAIILALLMIVPMLASCGDEEKSDRKDREEREDKEENEDRDETGDKEPGGIGDIIDGLFGDGEEKPAQTVHQTTGEADVPVSPQLPPELAAIDEYVDSLASDYDFSGQTFTWIGGGSQAPEDLIETGDILNDALYYRHRDIEEKFQVTFTNYIPESVDGEEYNPIVHEVRRDILAGTNKFNAGYGIAPAVCQPLFQNGCLTDVSGFEGIDLDREWWTPTLRETYALGGGVYFLNGDIVTSNYTDAHVVLFNKQIADEYGINEMYSLVKDGSWTFDKMFELASYIPTNENEEGAYRYATPDGMAVLYASGYPVIEFDAEGTPYVQENLSAELSSLADKYSAVFGDNTQTAHAKVMTTDTPEVFKDKYGFEDADEMFSDDMVLFYFTVTSSAIDLRSEDVVFGILPMPKGSADQDDYITYGEPWLNFNVFVPKSGNDQEMTGVILEAMAALGRKYLRPAYYDSLLKSRNTYDADSFEMLDIIFESKVYDVTCFGDYSFSYTNVLNSAIEESSAGFASRHKLNARMFNRRMQSLLETIKK